MEKNEFKPEHFAREDSGDDELFYLQPRLVKHIDEPACAALTDYYARALPTGGDILDLMSSYASHLPAEAVYGRVVGLGMNMRELEENEQLSERHVHNLNTHPVMPFTERSFDACILAVSVQYLTRPVEVFADVARVLKPDALLASRGQRNNITIWRRTDIAESSLHDEASYETR